MSPAKMYAHDFSDLEFTPPASWKHSGTMFDVSEDRELIGSAELRFRCTACDGDNIVDALRFRTTNKLLGSLTIWVTYETAVKCPGCQATYRTGSNLDELVKLSPNQIGERFRLRIGFVEKFLVLAGWLLIFTGPVSMGMFIAAWFMVPHATRGWRKAARRGLVVSSLFTAVMVLILTLGP